MLFIRDQQCLKWVKFLLQNTDSAERKTLLLFLSFLPPPVLSFFVSALPLSTLPVSDNLLFTTFSPEEQSSEVKSERKQICDGQVYLIL